jgi:RNA polymerase sigma factor (sigma-70 family)
LSKERIEEVQESTQDVADDEHRTRMKRLVVDHHEDLIRFLAARLRSRHEAREVAQEAYVRLLGLRSPDSVGYLRAFLYRTALNIAIDRRRRAETHKQALQIPWFAELVETRTPERLVADGQTLERLSRLIQALPAQCQRAFVLHQVEGADFPDIARTMGLSESSVRKYVMRALLHCRAKLDLEDADAAKQ